MKMIARLKSHKKEKMRMENFLMLKELQEISINKKTFQEKLC